MGRNSYSNKTEADNLKKIEISFLKKHGYLNGAKSGAITWTHGWSEAKSSINIENPASNEYVRLCYAQTDRDTQEKKDFDYKVGLVTTACNYGGHRYWFACPCYKSGVYCGKRVGVLYKNGDYFACRHCYDLTYASRNLSGMSKQFRSATFPNIDKLRESIKFTHYNGKPTRKYSRYLRLENRLENALAGLQKSLPFPGGL